MKDMIMERLGKMEDLQQRRLLRDLMSGVFLHLVDYQENLNQQLERRIFEEVDDQDTKYDVFVSMCSRGEWDPLHEYLFPMIPADTRAPLIDLQAIAPELRSGGEVNVCTLFLECKHVEIQQLLLSKRRFKGEVVTAHNRYAAEFRLERNTTYIKEIELLYQIFLLNGLPWKTINHPYAHKFVDAVLMGIEGEIREGEEVLEISVHLEEYESRKRADMIPLWNLQRIELKTGGFPVPAADRINFEHVLPLRKTGMQHGYLVEVADDTVRYVKRTPEELTVVSSLEQSDAWQVLMLVEPFDSAMSKPGYALMSNRQKANFIDGYRRRQGQIVRSRGEILRLVHSFAAAEALELTDVEIRPPGSGQALTYELNRFITDEIRVDNGKWRMCLKFADRGFTRSLSFLAEDVLSFLVSEVQLMFPEYRCEGEWA